MFTLPDVTNILFKHWTRRDDGSLNNQACLSGCRTQIVSDVLNLTKTT